MGMFDEICCDQAQPDVGIEAESVFQTKSFPYAGLMRYRITAQGRLIDNNGNDLEPDGYLIFYCAPGNPRTYRARFQDGQLQEIVEHDDEPGRHYGLSSFRYFNTPGRGIFGREDG